MMREMWMSITGHTSFNAWRFAAKVFVIVNMTAYLALMLWSPGSLTYEVSRSQDAGIVPTVTWAVGIIMLIIDLLLSDHRVNGRRHWWGDAMVPAAYMVAGGGYLVFAYMCTLIDGTWALMLGSVLQALMCGWVAFLQKSLGTCPYRNRDDATSC